MVWILMLSMLLPACALDLKGHADGQEAGAPDVPVELDAAQDFEGTGEIPDDGIPDRDDPVDMPPDEAADPDLADPMEDETVVEDTVEVVEDIIEEDIEEEETPCPPVSGWPRPMCSASDPDLAACYDFNADSGTTVVDGSANANNGISTNASYDAGVEGSAIVFAGSGQVIVADHDSLDPTGAFTLEAWIRPDSIPGSGRWGIIDKDGQYGMFLYAGAQIYCIVVGSGSTSVGPISAGVWTHVACVFDGDSMIVYLDGLPFSEASAVAASNTGGAGLYLGANSPSGGDHFSGRIDGVRLWTRGLTPEEACWAALY
jgi:hypothetical protein